MGYYSTMEGRMEFKTRCASQEEIERIFKESFDGGPDMPETIDELGYDFLLRQEDEVCYIQLDAESCNQKHRHDYDLAVFISKLLAPDERSYLLFTGEDNDKWGYAISPGEVFDIDIIYHIQGIPLETWLVQSSK